MLSGEPMGAWNVLIVVKDLHSPPWRPLWRMEMGGGGGAQVSGVVESAPRCGGRARRQMSE